MKDIQADTDDKIDALQASSILKTKKKEERLQNCKYKVLHEQYLRQPVKVRAEQNCAFLYNGDMKGKAESLSVVTQNYSIRKNLVKLKLSRSLEDL